MTKPAVLVLADGTVFEGISIGIDGITTGEIVFNTAMTGYQEILTDPSYAQQIITFTYPHIGNVGINTQDEEANEPCLAGLVIRDLASMASNWRSRMSLQTYLTRHSIVGIAEIDTRHLTRLLRDGGAQNACIMAGEQVSAQQALNHAREFPGLEGMDLAREVTTRSDYRWMHGTWQLQGGYQTYSADNLPYHVVVYDFGVKRNILRLLADRGCKLTVVPAQTPAQAVLALQADGVFLSNGPGDPAACDYAIDNIKALLAADLPLFGICLGYQLLALAAGAKTVKMKFGHHGGNHPVVDCQTKTVAITSQNHGFAVSEDSLPEGVIITHRSLFDNSLQGIRLSDKPAYGFQGHPEASPGPHDIIPLFDPFIHAMRDTHKSSTTSATQDKNNRYAETQ